MQQTFRIFRTGLLAVLLAFLPLVTTYNSAEAGENTCTWTGGGVDDNWSTAANWTCDVGSVPDDGYNLEFPIFPSSQSPNNDLLETNVYGVISFTGDASTCNGSSNYTITGNDMILSGDIIGSATGGGLCVISFADMNFQLIASIAIDLSGSDYIGLSFEDNDETSNDVFNLQSFDLALVSGSTANTRISLPIHGSGSITSSGVFNNSLGRHDTASTFTGTVTVESGLLQTNRHGLGASSAGTAVQNGATLDICDTEGNGAPPSFNINEPITLSGSARYPGFEAKLQVGECSFGGTGVNQDARYYRYSTSLTANLTGTITLTSDQNFTAGHENVNITGDLIGSGFELTLFDSDFGGGTLNISSGSNTTNTPNGSYILPLETVTLSDALPGESIYVGGLSRVYITGSRGDVFLDQRGILGGTGTVGNIDSDGGVIDPGLSPGCLNTGNLDFDSATEFEVEIGGTTVCTEYDQTDVTGTVSLGGAQLGYIFVNGFIPSLNDTFTIINNDGADAVTGTFNGLAEGATFVLDDVTFTISYAGGTGNDVTLTATNVPGPPDTGFMTLQSNVALPALAIAASGGVLLMRRLKFKKFLKRA